MNSEQNKTPSKRATELLSTKNKFRSAPFLQNAKSVLAQIFNRKFNSSFPSTPPFSDHLLKSSHSTKRESFGLIFTATLQNNIAPGERQTTTICCRIIQINGPYHNTKIELFRDSPNRKMLSVSIKLRNCICKMAKVLINMIGIAANLIVMDLIPSQLSFLISY